MTTTRVSAFSWHEFNFIVETLAQGLERSFEMGKDLQYIMGVPRGGLCLAVALSHRLELPMHDSEFMFPAGGLWVDDIFDSGRTYMNYHGEQAGAAVVWLLREGVKRPPNLRAGALLAPHTWAIFPWEDRIQAAEDMARYHARSGPQSTQDGTTDRV